MFYINLLSTFILCPISSGCCYVCAVHKGQCKYTDVGMCAFYCASHSLRASDSGSNLVFTESVDLLDKAQMNCLGIHKAAHTQTQWPRLCLFTMVLCGSVPQENCQKTTARNKANCVLMLHSSKGIHFNGIGNAV